MGSGLGNGGGKGRARNPFLPPEPELTVSQVSRSHLAVLNKFNVMENMSGIPQLYFGGDMEAAIPLSGEVCGRIDAVLSAAQVIDETIAGFYDCVNGLARQYPA